MNATITKLVPHRRQWFAPVVEYLVGRFIFSLLSAGIVYAGYRMFLL